MNKPHWTIRLARPEEAPAILELAHAVHGYNRPELNQSYLQWRYWNDTPFRADVLAAEHEGRLIGIQPVALFDFQQGGKQFKGAMYTGVMTHPDHRRRGVFRALVDAANEYAVGRGAAFSMTMPNTNALAGFRQFVGWRYPGQIATWFKVIDGSALLRPKIGAVLAKALGWVPNAVLRRRRAVSGMLPRHSCELVASPPNDLDALMDDCAVELGGVFLRRSSAYWSWRYCNRPLASYRPTRTISPAFRTLLLRDGSRPVGMVVTSVAVQLGVEVGMIVDLVARGGLGPIRRLLCEAEADLRGRGLGVIALQATHPVLQRALADEGYLCPKPGRLPRQFHFAYRPFDGPLSGDLRIGDWFLMLGDSDNT